MNLAICETVEALLNIIEDESAHLKSGATHQVRELAAAKLKLTAQLEKLLAEQERTGPNWRELLPHDEASDLADAIRRLQAAAEENALLLKRHIELSRDLLGAIAAEAKRLAGTRSETYVASGDMRHLDLPAPISVNANL